MDQFVELLTRLREAVAEGNVQAIRDLEPAIRALPGDEGSFEAVLRQAVLELRSAALGLMDGDLDLVRTSMLGASMLAALASEHASQDLSDALLAVGDALHQIAPDNLPVNGYLAMRLYDARSDAARRERATQVMQFLVRELEAPDATAETGLDLAGVQLSFLHDALAELHLASDVREAAEHGRRALELSPDGASEDCWIALALEAGDRMDFEDALGFLARIDEYTTPSRRYFVELQRARWLVFLGRADEALAQLQALESAPGEYPPSPWTRELTLARAEACCELGCELDWVVTACSGLLEADAQDFHARVRLANALARAERLDEAKEQVDYLLSLGQPDMPLYFTAGVLYKLLGMRAKERGAGFQELDRIYDKAMRYICGNGELEFMQIMHEEQVGYIGHLWGEVIYDQAARIGNSGDMQGALDFLHQREERAFAPDLKNWVTLSLAELYTLLAQNDGNPVFRSQALRYLDELTKMEDLDPAAITQLRARLG